MLIATDNHLFQLLSSLLVYEDDITQVATPTTQATGSITVNSAPAAPGDTITIGGVVLTGAAGPRTPGLNDFDATLGTVEALAIEIVAALGDLLNGFRTLVSASHGGAGVVNLTAVPVGTDGNNVTLEKSAAVLTVSGAQLSGGVYELQFSPDKLATVVRWGTSEYVQLLKAISSNDDNVRRPFISVQFLRDRYNVPGRSVTIGGRLCAYTDETMEEVKVNKYPVPVVSEFQVDIRSPRDIWLREIETEIARTTQPVYYVNLKAAPLGPAVGLIDFPVRFTFSAAERAKSTISLNDRRVHRTVFRVSAETWLVPRTSGPNSTLETLKTVLQVRTQYCDLDTETLLETVVTT